jgi:phage shock protein A
LAPWPIASVWALDYENLRVDYLRQQTELEMAKAQLPHAKFDVDLSQRLLGEKVVSEFEYHSFLSAYDSLQAQAAQLTKNVEELEKKLLDARDIIENSPGRKACGGWWIIFESCSSNKRLWRHLAPPL